MNLKKYEAPSDLSITIGEVRDGITNMIKNGTINQSARVLWIDHVEPGDSYIDRYDACPGSVLFALEWLDNGEITNGVLKLTPPAVSKILN